MPMENNTWQQIREVLAGAEMVALMGHTNPDGDAIGSVYGLALALQAAGKETDVFLEPYGEVFSLIPTGGLCRQTARNQYDVAVALDCGDEERLGAYIEVFRRGKTTVNIDHHGSNVGFGDYRYVDGDASSASELVYNLLDGFLPFNCEIATALYAGILFDTGGFRHSSTSPDTLRKAAHLMSFGVPFTKLYNEIFFSRSLAEARALGKAAVEASLTEGILFSFLSLDDLASVGATPQDTAEISGFLKGVRQCRAAVLCYEKTPGQWKASMRSDEGTNVAEVAMHFGGGGHKQAAGCTLVGSREEIEQKIRSAFLAQ